MLCCEIFLSKSFPITTGIRSPPDERTNWRSRRSLSDEWANYKKPLVISDEYVIATTYLGRAVRPFGEFMVHRTAEALL